MSETSFNPFITLKLTEGNEQSVHADVGEMVTKGWVEVVSPPEPAPYNPELVESLGEGENLTPVITFEKIRQFIGRNYPSENYGLYIDKTFKSVGRVDPEVAQFLYFEPENDEPVGYLADRFDELLESLGIDLFEIKNARLNINGISRSALRQLNQLSKKLRLEKPLI